MGAAANCIIYIFKILAMIGHFNSSHSNNWSFGTEINKRLKRDTDITPRTKPPRI